MKTAMLAQGLSVQTVNRRLAVVRRVLNVAYREWDWISQPLGQKIKLMSERGCSREIYLSREEVDGLLEAVTNSEARKVMVLAAYTGLRRSELLKLTPGNWQSPYLVLSSNTKNKKPRTVPVIEGLHDCVTLPFEISENGLRVAFEGARAAIGRPDLRFHDLRHTFASWLMANPTVPVTMVRDLMGHSNLGVTSKYSHLRGDTFGLIDQVLGQVKH
jgi:integrase